MTFNVYGVSRYLKSPEVFECKDETDAFYTLTNGRVVVKQNSFMAYYRTLEEAEEVIRQRDYAVKVKQKRERLNNLAPDMLEALVEWEKWAREKGLLETSQYKTTKELIEKAGT